MGCARALKLLGSLTNHYVLLAQVKASFKLSEDFKKGPPKKKVVKKPAAKKVRFQPNNLAQLSDGQHLKMSVQKSSAANL